MKIPNRIGEKSINYQGIEMEIIEYRRHNDITVMFSDGTKRITSYKQFKLGTVKNLYFPSVYGVGFIGEEYSNKGNEVVYTSWSHMLCRCYNKKDSRYRFYGATGVKVCEEWKNNPSAFCEWALANGFSEELTLDRIDVNGDYSPENCRWSTKTEQARNKRNNRFIEYNGSKVTVSEYSEITGVKQSSIDWRLNKSSMCESEAVKRPIRTQKKGIELGFDLSEECRKRGLKLTTVWARINKLGWSVEDALTIKKNGLYAKKPNKNT